MADQTIQSVILDIAMRVSDTKVPAPDLTPVTQSAKKAEKSFKDVGKAVDESFKQVERQLDNVDKALDNLSAANDRAINEMAAANQRLQSGLEEIGSAALKVARGFALFAASGEEDLQKMLKTIVKIQAGFDLVSGSIQGLGKSLDAIIDLTVALGRMSQAEATLIQAQKARLALSLILNPLTAAIAVTVGAAAGAYAIWSREQEKLNEIQRESLRLSQALFDLQQQRAAQAREHANFLDRVEGAEQRRATRRAQQERALSGGLLRNQDPAAQLAALQAQEELARTRLNRVEGEAAILNRGGNTGGALEAEKQLADLQAGELSRLQRIRDLKQQIHQESIKDFETQKRTLETEQKRLQSLEERLGRLSEGEVNRLKRLQEQARGGNLTRAGALQIEDLVGSNAASSGFFQERGRSRGGAGAFADIFGGGVQAGRTSLDVGAEIRKAAEAIEAERAELQRYFETNQTNQESLVNEIRQANQRIEILRSALEGHDA